MKEPDAKRWQSEKKENGDVKKIFSEAMLEIRILKETIEKNFEPRSSPRFNPTGHDGGLLLTTQGLPFLLNQ